MTKLDIREIVLSKYSHLVNEYVERITDKVIRHHLLTSLDHLSTDTLVGTELFNVLENHDICSLSTSSGNEIFIISEKVNGDFDCLVRGICNAVMPTGHLLKRSPLNLKEEYQDNSIVENLIIVISYLNMETHGTVFFGIPLKTILNQPQARKIS